MHSAYAETLRRSWSEAGSLLCMGIDPVVEYLPGDETNGAGERVTVYITGILDSLAIRGLVPSAFKPNIGFFHAIDRPLVDDFGGSRALVRILTAIRERFPHVPVILDAKRGDIARSSENYAIEAFRSWEVNAVTASPYMGDDSLQPLFDSARDVGGGVYVLTVTSNPGASRFQGCRTDDGPFYRIVAGQVCRWAEAGNPCGAVVGATHAEERDFLLQQFGRTEVPVLIPGVGTQGGSATEVIEAIRSAGYPAHLARVNVSSGITHPWKGESVPRNWRDEVIRRFEEYHEALS
jgi:orotidine-5'-phosphate decarboxylase